MKLSEFRQIEDLLSDDTEIIIMRETKSNKQPIGFYASNTPAEAENKRQEIKITVDENKAQN